MTPDAPGSETGTQLLLTGRIVTPDAVVDEGAVVAEGDRLAWVGAREALPATWSHLTPPLWWRPGLTLLPGLVDIHCHGGAGGEFGGDVASSRAAAAHHHAAGTTSVVASLVSAPADVLVAGAAALAPLVDSGELAGLHLEGPFLSTVRCGAQDPACLLDVDTSLVARLVEAAGTALAHMTFAPERLGGADLPKLLAQAGALGALGHTDASFDTCAHALRQVGEAGARGGLPLVTHLFNGMPPLHHRSPGPAAAGLAAAGRGEAVLEVIADGVHLDAGTVRMVFDLVGGRQVALVSDAMSASGLADGDYTLGGRAVQVRGRAARLVAGGSLAGGVSTLLDQVRWCVTDLGLDLREVTSAASSTPARTLGLSDVGRLEAGALADVLVVESDLHLHRVLFRGSWL